MQRKFIALIGPVVVSLVLSSCGPGQVLGPKSTPTSIPTPTPKVSELYSEYFQALADLSAAKLTKIDPAKERARIASSAVPDELKSSRDALVFLLLQFEDAIQQLNYAYARNAIVPSASLVRSAEAETEQAQGWLGNALIDARTAAESYLSQRGENLPLPQPPQP